MTSLIFSAPPDEAINMSGDAMAVKVGLLLSDLIGVTSTVICHTFIKDNVKSGSLEFQIRLYFSRRPEEAAETFGSVEQVLAVLKASKKMKHVGGKQIVAMKKFESSLKTVLEDLFDEMETQMTTLGFTQLNLLIIPEKARQLNFLISEPEIEKPNLVKASQIFTLDKAAFPDSIPLWILHMETFTNEWWHKEHKPIYTEEIFTFHNLNILTAEELFVVNQSLEPTLKELRQKIEQWQQGITDGLPSPRNREFLLNNVVPNAIIPQQAYFEHPVITSAQEYNNQNISISVMLGEMYFEDIWAFYRQHNSIADATWEVLTSNEQYKEIGKQPCAVMLLKTNNLENLSPKPEKLEEQVVSVRKSITID